MERQIVVFELGNDHYGLDISAVEGIVKMQKITKLPKAPGYIEGITSLRGVAVPVMDLRRRFGLPPREWNQDTRIVVAYVNGFPVGMIVDGVSQVLRMQGEMIGPLQSLLPSAKMAVIEGVAKLPDRLVFLLDLSRILSFEEKGQTIDQRHSIAALKQMMDSQKQQGDAFCV